MAAPLSRLEVTVLSLLAVALLSNATVQPENDTENTRKGKGNSINKSAAQVYVRLQENIMILISFQCFPYFKL